MKRFVVSAILFSTLHYAVLVFLKGLIFLLAHIPPRIIHLDDLILVLVWLERILVLPRILLRRIWSGETTAGFLNFGLLAVNSICWGAVLAGCWLYGRRSRKN